MQPRNHPTTSSKPVATAEVAFATYLVINKAVASKSGSRRRASLDIDETSPAVVSPQRRESHMVKEDSREEEEYQRRAISVDACSVPRQGKSHILCPEYIDISAVYRFGCEIGDGASGTVRLCYRGPSNIPLACKSIPKSILRSQLDIQDLKMEVKTLQIMQAHPSVIRLKGVYEDSKQAHLVMDCCEGGDLFSRIKERKFYSEQEAAMVCRSVASVLAFAHAKGIMHRDLKPENILLSSKYSDTDVKVADFGCAAFFRPGEKLNQLVGSPLYIAPSVLACSYGPEADIWSLGVVLYVLLSGEPPFWGNSNAEIFSAVQSQPLVMEKRRWRHVSLAAKRLVRKLLNRDSSAAISALQVLEDPWILSQCPSTDSPLHQPAVGNRISSSRRPSVELSSVTEERNPAASSSSSSSSAPNQQSSAHHRRLSSDGRQFQDAVRDREESAPRSAKQNVFGRTVLVPSPMPGASEDDGEEDIPVATVVVTKTSPRSGHSKILSSRSCGNKKNDVTWLRYLAASCS